MFGRIKKAYDDWVERTLDGTEDAYYKRVRRIQDCEEEIERLENEIKQLRKSEQTDSTKRRIRELEEECKRLERAIKSNIKDRDAFKKELEKYGRRVD